MSDTDIVVIGAGLAGLVAARTVRAAGLTVAVVEARDRVGGRTCTERHGGERIDLGGQWLGPTQTRIQALARELGVGTYRQYDAGVHLLDVRGRVRRYEGNIPKLPLHALLDLHLSLRALEALAAQIPEGHPWDAPRAAEWDAETLESYLRRHVRTDLVRGVVEGAVRAFFCCEPSELSFLYFLSYVRSAGGLLKLTDTEGGAQQDRFVEGSQEVSERLAAPLGDALYLSSPVLELAQDARGCTVRTARGTHTARAAVVCVPPHLAARIHWTPALPTPREHLLQRAPMGSSIKFVASYATPFWRTRGLSGAAVSDRGPVHLVFDDCHANGSHPGLVGFVLGQEARLLSARPEAERDALIRRELARFFGPDAAHPEALHVKDWNREPWSLGCPVSIFPAGALSLCGPALRAPAGRVFFGGTETAVRWTGYMDGAVESGERAAREALALLA